MRITNHSLRLSVILQINQKPLSGAASGDKLKSQNLTASFIRYGLYFSHDHF